MSAKKRGLGRGLDALLGASNAAQSAADNDQPGEQAQASASEDGALKQLPVDLVQRGKYQPRKDIEPESLQELADSIKAQGVMQPIVVRPVSDRKYEIIAGERRWRATQLAGLDVIPAVVRDVSDEAAIAMALIENIQREDLNPLETAEAFHRLIKDFDLTHDDLSKKVGKDRATVTNYLRILKLPLEIKKNIAGGSLSIGHAKALLQVENQRLQKEIAARILRKGLSVRETEALCKKAVSGKPPQSKSGQAKDPQIASLEEKLIHSLGTKVRLIHKSNKRGRIEIDYYSLEELDRLLDILIA